MSVSSISSSDQSSVWSVLQNLSSSQVSSTSGTSNSSSGSATSPQDFLDSELEKQGFTGSKLSDLQSKIQSAVQSLQSSSGGNVDPSQIHDTINSVLQSAGVNTDQIDQDAKANGPKGPPPGGAPPQGSSSNTSSGSLNSSSGSIDSLLSSLGVDPSKFQSALSSALSSSDSSGNIDLSQLFSSAGVGSQVDVSA